MDLYAQEIEKEINHPRADSKRIRELIKNNRRRGFHFGNRVSDGRSALKQAEIAAWYNRHETPKKIAENAFVREDVSEMEMMPSAPEKTAEGAFAEKSSQEEDSKVAPNSFYQHHAPRSDILSAMEDDHASIELPKRRVRVKRMLKKENITGKVNVGVTESPESKKKFLWKVTEDIKDESGNVLFAKEDKILQWGGTIGESLLFMTRTGETVGEVSSRNVARKMKFILGVVTLGAEEHEILNRRAIDFSKKISPLRALKFLKKSIVQDANKQLRPEKLPREAA